MDYTEIEALARDLSTALENEILSIHAVEDLKELAETLKAHVLSEATIDGKNAEARALQTTLVLSDSTKYQGSLRGIADAQRAADGARVHRVHMETLVSLTRAWPYSQAGPK